MIVCRPRQDYARKWKISAAFNVSQHDKVPLKLFQKTLGCGAVRKGGNNGWYYEVQRLSDIRSIIIPFFTRFPLSGKKQQGFLTFKSAVTLLAQKPLSNDSFKTLITLRETMNGKGKRRYDSNKILRDYTPNPE